MVKTETSPGFLVNFFFNRVNWQFYHQVSNKFPYHSTYVEMYTVT